MTPENAPALVPASWLAGHLGEPSLRLIEIASEPAAADYASGHIPGAIPWFWKDLLWDAWTRQFATPQQVAQRLAARGIGKDATLVLYGGRFQFASYAYWALAELCGLPGIRLLDGGWPAWLAGGWPVSTAVPEMTPASWEPVPAARDDSSRAGRDEVLSRVGAPGTVILDARSAEEYAGLRVKPAPGPDHGAERAGRIPGAVHLPASALLGPDGSLRPAGDIARIFRTAGAAPDQAAEVILYCRLGHRASLLWFAMTRVLGWRHARVYDGSWTEWGSCVGMPIQRGG